MTGELEAIFQKRKIGKKGGWAFGFNFGDDCGKFRLLDSELEGADKLVDFADPLSARNPSCRSYASDVAACRGRRGESADRE